MNRPSRLLLYDHCPMANLPAAHQIADLDPDHIATTKFAIDSKIEQRAVTKAPVVLEKKSDCSYVPWF